MTGWFNSVVNEPPWTNPVMSIGRIFSLLLWSPIKSRKGELDPEEAQDKPSYIHLCIRSFIPTFIQQILREHRI